MARVAAVSGKHAGARKAPKQSKSTTFPLSALGYAVALTACVVAWGYLVWVAIDFGTTARAGNTAAWGLLGLATLGAVACLFVGLLLAARLLRVLGLTSSGSAHSSSRSRVAPPAPRAPAPPARVSGGRRALR